MASNKELVALAGQVMLGNYRPAPLVMASGSGCRLQDVEGRRYLDMCAGVAVVSVGHAHPKLAAAIAKQAVCCMYPTYSITRTPSNWLCS